MTFLNKENRMSVGVFILQVRKVGLSKMKDRSPLSEFIKGSQNSSPEL